MRTTILGCLLLLSGCAITQPASLTTQPDAPATQQVLVCKGGGAFVHCRRVSATDFRKLINELQQPPVGTRIARY